MLDSPTSYGLDLHSTMILEDYCARIPVYEKIKEVVSGVIKKRLDDNGIIIAAYESRIKTQDSLAGKLELKGSKYRNLDDLTDIFGARIITFYNDEVDKVAALVENLFEIDWDNSVDKRKMHDLDSFGYMSLHYICSIPESMYHDPEHPEINRIRFEVQMRSILQHSWANLYHDTGYKTGVEIPKQYIRSLNRLAGLLELADDEISMIRKDITDYRRKVQSLVASGNFAEVPLNGDTFKSYLNLEPFQKLNERIAAINQAEIVKANMMPFLKVFMSLGCKNLGDIEAMRNEYDMRRRFVVASLNAMGLSCFNPEGAFYCFPCIKSTGLSSEDFCTRLLHSKHVALVPGSAFGDCGEGYVRLSYSYSIKHLTRAMELIREFLTELKDEDNG